jgi:hypothetical protein
MIVLKSAQDSMLQALQILAGIVERSHTVPMIEIVRRRESPLSSLSTTQACPAVLPSYQGPLAIKYAQRRLGAGLGGFFCARKVNARNAP